MEMIHNTYAYNQLTTVYIISLTYTINITYYNTTVQPYYNDLDSLIGKQLFQNTYRYINQSDIIKTYIGEALLLSIHVRLSNCQKTTIVHTM